MDLKNAVILVAIPFLLTTIPMPSQAAKQSECAIWLCLPTGFGTGCSQAKKAFRKRIRKGKSPLPSLSSCLVKSKPGDADNTTYTLGGGAFVNAEKVCRKWEPTGGKSDDICVETESLPERFVDGHKCPNLRASEIPHGYKCDQVKYIEIFIDGKLIGKRQYF